MLVSLKPLIASLLWGITEVLVGWDSWKSPHPAFSLAGGLLTLKTRSGIALSREVLKIHNNWDLQAPWAIALHCPSSEKVFPGLQTEPLFVNVILCYIAYHLQIQFGSIVLNFPSSSWTRPSLLWSTGSSLLWRLNDPISSTSPHRPCALGSDHLSNWTASKFSTATFNSSLIPKVDEITASAASSVLTRGA